MTTDDIESYFGSIEKVAAFFGITTEAVYQWRNRPGQLPGFSRHQVRTPRRQEQNGSGSQ